MGEQMKPHKHAELIKDWADGASIQYKNPEGFWEDRESPFWSELSEFRLKPEAPRPALEIFDIHFRCHTDETGKIVKVEVL